MAEATNTLWYLAHTNTIHDNLSYIMLEDITEKWKEEEKEQYLDRSV